MSARPFVSCICVTKNRRILLRKAIEYFQRARHFYWVAGGRAELVIVDGSAAPFDLSRLPCSAQDVRYFHEPSTTPRVGHWHNVACDKAQGEIVIQWDDDDWQHPYRIVRQSATLEAYGSPAFTFSSAFWWYHVSAARACRTRSWGTVGTGSMGAIFAYHRALWQLNPFRDVDEAEDQGWWTDHKIRATPFLDSEDPSLIVYMRHNVNGSPLSHYRFTDDDTRDARELMGSDVAFYDELAEILPLTPWNHPNAPASRMHVFSPLQNQWLKHFR